MEADSPRAEGAVQPDVCVTAQRSRPGSRSGGSVGRTKRCSERLPPGRARVSRRITAFASVKRRGRAVRRRGDCKRSIVDQAKIVAQAVAPRNQCRPARLRRRA